MKKTTIASKKQIKFNKIIERIFINEILPEGSLFTDESRLVDFVSFFDIAYSKKKLNNGLYLFEVKSKRNLTDKDFEISLVEYEGTNEKQEMTQKIYDIFEVDISDYFGLTFPKLFHFIQKETKKIKKIELGLI